MKKRVKNIIIGFIVGIIIGMWFGINIGKGKSLLSNPFAGSNLQEKLKQTSGEVLEKSGKALEKSGKALQETLPD
jgi:hypothetical protein